MDSMIPMGQQMAVPKTSQTEMMITKSVRGTKQQNVVTA